ncbi:MULTISPECIES: hypothetical protein [unclassified Pseudomonas]|uniref:BufA2 family periplasmic bufferin-type metallophore n=1 Tax=unclassified Pseudomonas TaxID=196821 RepID=UPI0015A4712A|nr:MULTISPECIES: hypothetical protein [unclassified Pseudomonas]NWC96229.1 hypothetical protein [Pseudomonas sp. IPO3779]NWD16745.1 hypothetical protein [Pseudomonas sp. IPO3778]
MNIKSAAAGAALALAAATMFAGVVTQAQAADTAVHCYGINACKGQNDCKTANNACKGQGSCKGMGFKAEPSAAACAKLGGKVGE